MDCRAGRPRTVFNPFFSQDAPRYDSAGRQATFRYFVPPLFLFFLFSLPSAPTHNTSTYVRVPREYFCRRCGIFKNTESSSRGRPLPPRLHATRMHLRRVRREKKTRGHFSSRGPQTKNDSFLFFLKYTVISSSSTCARDRERGKFGLKTYELGVNWKLQSLRGLDSL